MKNVKFKPTGEIIRLTDLVAEETVKSPSFCYVRKQALRHQLNRVKQPNGGYIRLRKSLRPKTLKW